MVTSVDDRLAFDNNNKSYSLTDSSIVHSFNERFVLSKCVLVVRIWCDFGLVCGFAEGEMIFSSAAGRGTHIRNESDFL